MVGTLVFGDDTEGGDVLGSVKAALSDFLCRQPGDVGEDDKCEVCLGGRLPFLSCGEAVGSPLSGEVVGVVARALLVPSEGGRQLRVCGECSVAWRNLSDLFFRLEELRVEFNDLRRRVGREVILGSLGKSEENVGEWEEEVRRVEHIFPACVEGRNAVDSLKSLWEESEVTEVTDEIKEELVEEEDPLSERVDFCDFLEDEEEKVELNGVGLIDTDDDKLKTMTPKVILQRLKETPETSEDEEDPSADEDFLPEDDLPSRRQLRKRLFVDVDQNSDDSDSQEDERATQRRNPKKSTTRRNRSKSSKPDKPRATCFLCSLKFTSKTAKLVHDELLHLQNAPIHVESQTRLFSRLCGKSSLIPADLATHEETFHATDLRFLCLHCNPHRKFSRPELLSAHSAVHSSSDPLRCSLCAEHQPTPVTFESPSQLDAHLTRVHFFGVHPKFQPSKKPECANPRLKDPRILHKATCRWCIKTDKQTGLFRIKRHERLNHADKFTQPCATCGLKFSDAAEALTCQETHKTAEAGDSQANFKCFVCNIRRSSGEELREHLEVKHTMGGVACDLCVDEVGVHRKRHQGAMELKVHKARLHGGEWPFKCPQCGKGEDNLTLLEDHVLKEHAGDGLPQLAEEIRRKHEQVKGNGKKGRPKAGELLQPRKCAQCGETFTSTRSLQKHRRTFHSLAPPPTKTFVCEECGKELRSKATWELHMKGHRGEKDAVCHVCGKAFVSPSCLVLHLRIHTGERPYKCHICPKSFTQDAHLRAHWGYHKKIGTWEEKPLQPDP